jgi:hypothetical protein
MHSGRFSRFSPKAPLAIFLKKAEIPDHSLVVTEPGSFAGNHLFEQIGRHCVAGEMVSELVGEVRITIYGIEDNRIPYRERKL